MRPSIGSSSNVFFFSFFLLFVSSIYCSSVSALGVGVYPSSLSVEDAFENHTYGRELIVMNPSDAAVSFSLVQESNSGIILTASPSEGKIPANGKVTVNILVSVPADLSSGEYDDILLATIQGASSHEFTVSPSLAIPVHTSVLGMKRMQSVAESDVHQDVDVNIQEDVNEDLFSDNLSDESTENITTSEDLKDSAVFSPDETAESKTSIAEDKDASVGLIGRASAFFKEEQISLVDATAFVVFALMLAAFAFVGFKGKSDKKKRKKRAKHAHS